MKKRNKLEALAIELYNATGEDIYYDSSFDDLSERLDGGSATTKAVDAMMAIRSALGLELKRLGLIPKYRRTE